MLSIIIAAQHRNVPLPSHIHTNLQWNKQCDGDISLIHVNMRIIKLSSRPCEYRWG